MPSFMFLYRGGDTDPKAASPEEIQQIMKLWMDWIQDAMTKGWMLSPGDALEPTSGKIVNANKTITDGPFVESKEIIGGYSIVQADTLEAAAELAKGCPALLNGGKVEVRALMNLAPPQG